MVTFVVRVWRPGEGQIGAPDEELKGSVEHIESGEAGVFASESALLDFVRTHLNREAREQELRS